MAAGSHGDGIGQHGACASGFYVGWATAPTGRGLIGIALNQYEVSPKANPFFYSQFILQIRLLNDLYWYNLGYFWRRRGWPKLKFLFALLMYRRADYDLFGDGLRGFLDLLPRTKLTAPVTVEDFRPVNIGVDFANRFHLRNERTWVRRRGMASAVSKMLICLLKIQTIHTTHSCYRGTHLKPPFKNNWDFKNTHKKQIMHSTYKSISLSL